MRSVLPIFFLVACVPAPSDPVSGLDNCGAAPWQARAGQPFASVQSVPQGARVIRPGDSVTEDFSPSRLNIDLDATDLIARAWCG